MKILKILSILIISINIVSCEKNKRIKIFDSKRDQHYYRSLKAKDMKKADIGPIRLEALRDTAKSIGARGGLAWRAKSINALFEKYDRQLERVFNFNHMILDNNVLPPVLLEARNTANLASDDVIRISQQNYQILKQARFVTAAPMWRDYLWLHYSPPETPDRTLLPRNKIEREIWENYIDEGWCSGVLQAELIAKENIARITRDYDGMIRYKRLLKQNMVSYPFVAAMDLGVTGNESKLNINDRILKITAMPGLQVDSGKWKAEIVKHD